MVLKVPARAFNDKTVVGFMNAILGEINNIVRTFNGLSDVIIVDVQTGDVVRWNGFAWVNVSSGAAVFDATGAVTSPNATDLATVITLANETKTRVNSINTQFNALLASLRAANVIKS